MKQGLGLLLGALALVGMIGCSEKSDDGSKDGGNGKLNQKSVIGQASKIGYFPDGTKATALSGEQMAEISKTTEGAMNVNKAVAAATPVPNSLQRTGDAKVEAVQAFLQSSVARAFMRNRQGLDESKQFEQDLRSCIFEPTPGNENKPVETGDNNNKQISLVTWSSIRGAGCPLESRMDMDFKASMQRVGDKAAKMAGGLTFSSRMTMLNEADQLQFDFVNQGVQGRVEGEAFAEEGGKIEIAANGNLKGQLTTKNQGNIEAEILFDLYLMQLQQQQSGSVHAAAAPTAGISGAGQMQLAMAVILKTNSGNLLLQIFLQGSGDQAQLRVYLNGQEMNQASQN